jgi:hypothetical protein
MKLDNSNKRYSTIFAGILAILAVSIFLVLFIGCGDRNIYNQDEPQIRFSGICFDSEKDHLRKDIRRYKDVPVAQTEDWCGLYAETGTVTFSNLIYDSNGDDSFTTDDYWFNIDGTQAPGDLYLPLHIYDDMVDPDLYLGEEQLSDWQMTATTTGGYEPEQDPLWLSGFDIWQKKEVCGQICNTFMGKVYIHWEFLGENPDGSKDWKAHFMVENAAPTNDHIWLDSTFAPDGTGLEKTYNIEFYTYWTGCGEPTQQFGYILAQKYLYFRSPQLPIFIVS